VTPKSDYRLVLSTGDFIPASTLMSRVKAMTNGKLMDCEDTKVWQCLYIYVLIPIESATYSTGVAMESARFEEIHRNNTIKLKKKAEEEGFAPMYMIIKLKSSGKKK